MQPSSAARLLPPLALRTMSTLSAEETNALYEAVLARFPVQPNHAFAYGSAVFKQKGASETDQKKSMIDFIFAVDSPLDWHQHNIRANPSDYSFLRHFGSASTVSSLQSNFGAKIYYNTLIPWQNRLIKYGVISTADLLKDLAEWETLYVAGRLHKPAKFLRGPLALPPSPPSGAAATPSIVSAQRLNVLSASRAALLSLPASFTFRQFLMAVASLSYQGDFRMTVGENPHKIANIVDGGLEHFIPMYAEPLLGELRGVVATSSRAADWSFETEFRQDVAADVRAQLILALPTHARRSLLAAAARKEGWQDGGASIPEEEREKREKRIAAAAALSKDLPKELHQALASIIAGSALSQSIKGIATAGVVKAVRYAWEKVKKMRASAK